MVDAGQAKTQLDTIKNTISNISRIQELNDLLDKTSLQLDSVLNTTANTLYIDDEIKRKIESIRDILTPIGTAAPTRPGRPAINPLMTRLNTEYNHYDAIVRGATGGGRRGGGANRSDIEKRDSYRRHGVTGPSDIPDRYNEYNELLTLAERFDLGAGPFRTLNVDISTPAAVGTHVIDAATMLNGGAATPSYDLCDESGNPLTKRGNDYIVTIDGTSYTLSGITQGGNVFDFSRMTVNPNNIDISKELKLSVTAKYTSTFGIKVALNKPFSLKLTQGGPNDSAERRTEMEAYNTLSGNDVIGTQLRNTFEAQEADMLRKAVERAVTRINSPVFNALSPEQKEDFYKQILDPNRTTIPNLPAFGGATGGRRGLAASLEGCCNVDDFCDWFTADDKAWNKNANNTRTVRDYRQYIHDHFRDETRNYFDSRLDSFLIADHTIRGTTDDPETFLKAQLSNYLVNIETNKKDSPSIRNRLDTSIRRKDKRMKNQRRLRNKDANFMRFFSGSTKTFNNQSVNIVTTTPNNPVNNGPVKYDMTINVADNNKLGVVLKVNGEEPIPLQSGGWDPSILAQKILREENIINYQVRVHMVYTLYKGLLELAKEKNMKLEYYEKRSGEMREIALQNGNIVLNSVKYGTSAPYAKRTTTLFDETLFQNTNQFSNISMHNSIEEGIEGLSKHFAYAMNRLHKSYRKSTKRRLWRGFRSKNRTRLPTSFWNSPIRKWLNKKNVTKFDFEATVGETHIELKNNTFTVNDPKLGEKGPLVSKDLGKILNKRVDKTRIFDGRERDIVEAVYSNLVDKLRENSKVRRTNFGVVDDVTGNLYILDENGKFGYIRRDILKGKNILHRRFWGLVGTKAGVINANTLGNGRRARGYAYKELTEDQEKELLKNPLIMQGFVRAMNRRMGFYESVRAWFERH